MSSPDRCWIDAAGVGPRIVVVHGMMDRSSSFGRVARVLSECGHEVVRYDRRGYGRSIGLGPPASFAEQVDDLVAVVDGVPSTVFGHSYGGTIALAAAAAGVDAIRGVVAYESPLPWLDWWPATSAGAQSFAESSDPADAAERFMRRMIGDDRWERLPPSTRQARRDEGPTMAAELAQVRAPNPAPFDLHDVDVPVIAAHGTLGRDHHRQAMEQVAATVRHGTVHVVDGAGHGVHLSDQAAVAGLLDDLDALIGRRDTGPSGDHGGPVPAGGG